jgi:hypothetical protein
MVRATEAVVVIASTGEAVPSAAKAADVRNATGTKATESAGAEATHVASTKAAYVTPAKAAAHVTSAKAAAAMTAAATTAAGLGTSSHQAAGEHCARQDHHHSSSHDILRWNGRTIHHRSFQTPALPKAYANAGMERRWGCLCLVPIKFEFITPKGRYDRSTRRAETQLADLQAKWRSDSRCCRRSVTSN